MKDYIKINRAIDEHGIKNVEKNIAFLKENGSYPKKFNYPMTLQFELTGKCNLACKHCYNRSGDADRETLMTPEKWCDLARQIVDDGGIFQCIISGGEPLLLGDHLFDIMNILHDDGTSFIVITNGLLLTKEIARKFNKYRYYWFQISIDGADAKTHDNFRGVKGSFDKAIHGALEVSDLGIPLVIAHTVTPNNIMRMEEMVCLAYNLGANSIILGDVMPSGRAISNSDIMLNKEQKNYLYEQINILGKKYRGKITIQRSAELKHQMNRYTVDVNSGGIIRPDGSFRLDCMAPFVIGNVLESSIKELWLSKGIDAWHSKEVMEYINSIDEESQAGNIQNHVEADYLI